MIYSLVTRRIEDVPPDSFATGVTRFDSYLRRVFPDMRSITPYCLPTFTPDDVVIADNHLSLLVPDETPTIVVHHGCAAAHWDADPMWHTPETKAIVAQQAEMLTRPNRLYVAPSSWVRDEFAQQYGLPPDYARVIVNWVERIDRPGRPFPRAPVIVLGDWRDENKGLSLVRTAAAYLPYCLFEQLRCRSDAERIAAYQRADLYLCASASEGGSYAMADAEAAALPIVTTSTGNAHDFLACFVVEDRTPEWLAAGIRVYLDRQRQWPSCYETYTFDVWAGLWRQAVEDVRCGSRALKEEG